MYGQIHSKSCDNGCQGNVRRDSISIQDNTITDEISSMLIISPDNVSDIVDDCMNNFNYEFLSE